MIEVGRNDDYACLETEKYEFYYGYEHVINGEWAFYAINKETGIKVSYTTDKLEEKAIDEIRNITQYLLIGIGLFIDEKLIDHENYD